MKLIFGLNKNNIIYKLALLLCALISLFYLPYDYYTILRIAISALLFYLAYDYYRKGITALQVVLLILVLIFQPLHKLAIERPLWQFLEILIAIIASGLIFVDFKLTDTIEGK